MLNNLHIAVVVSLFNREITEKLSEGALSYLKQQGIGEGQIRLCEVPGAVEIPLVAKRLAAQKKYDAIICLGAVIQGETSHYDYVCEQVSQGCQQVMLTFDLPIIFGILTTKTVQQARDRVGLKKHKGIEAAKAALHMIDLLKRL